MCSEPVRWRPRPAMNLSDGDLGISRTCQMETRCVMNLSDGDLSVPEPVRWRP